MPLPSRLVLRDFRHSVSNAAWVVFGMVEILSDVDLRRRKPRAPGDLLTGLEDSTAGLKAALTPLFDADLDLLPLDTAREMIAAVGPSVEDLERRALQIQSGGLTSDPVARRSLAAVVAASGDLREQLATLVAAFPVD